MITLNDVDYQFYTDEYHGTVISDAEMWPRIALEAKAYVDSLITTQTAAELLENEDVLQRYNYAVCAVAETIYNQDEVQDVASESVGNHSVSYIQRSISDTEAVKRNKALTFLNGTGLLYRGLR